MEKEMKIEVKCDKCGVNMVPAPSKLRADGEQTYCGYLPCACDKRIMTDLGVVYPGTDEHRMLIISGRFNISDLL